MTKKRTAAFIVIIAFVVGHGLGLAQHSYMVYGQGTKSCGTWMSDRAPTLPPRLVDIRPLVSAISEQWVAGFITAIGFVGQDTLIDSDVVGMAAWIDTYCAAHPLDTLNGAAKQLVHELTEK